jgi:hypothetical protein
MAEGLDISSFLSETDNEFNESQSQHSSQLQGMFLTQTFFKLFTEIFCLDVEVSSQWPRPYILLEETTSASNNNNQTAVHQVATRTEPQQISFDIDGYCSLPCPRCGHFKVKQMFFIEWRLSVLWYVSHFIASEYNINTFFF